MVLFEADGVAAPAQTAGEIVASADGDHPKAYLFRVDAKLERFFDRPQDGAIAPANDDVNIFLSLTEFLRILEPELTIHLGEQIKQMDVGPSSSRCQQLDRLCVESEILVAQSTTALGVDEEQEMVGRALAIYRRPHERNLIAG